MIRESFNYADYLDLKKAVDDRSLNKAVWEKMARWIGEGFPQDRPLRILEIGAGIGTMIERLLETNLLGRCEYTAVELEAGFEQAASRRHGMWAERNGLRMHQVSDDRWSMTGDKLQLNVQWRREDALRIHESVAPEHFDLIIGHAVIDLLPVPVCMPNLLSCLRRQGAFYFSLNYAGETLFLPPDDEDDAILTAYNADMDKRFPDLDWKPSQTGQALGPWLVSQGHHLLAEGVSDWKLRARQDDPTNLFIENILATIETALAGMPGLPQWLVLRRQQLKESELMFRATNKDCFGLKA